MLTPPHSTTSILNTPVFSRIIFWTNVFLIGFFFESLELTPVKMVAHCRSSLLGFQGDFLPSNLISFHLNSFLFVRGKACYLKSNARAMGGLIRTWGEGAGVCVSASNTGRPLWVWGDGCHWDTLSGNPHGHGKQLSPWAVRWSPSSFWWEVFYSLRYWAQDRHSGWGSGPTTLLRFSVWMKVAALTQSPCSPRQDPAHVLEITSIL